KHWRDACNNTQDVYIFFQFSDFQLAYIFDSTFNFFNWSSNTQQTFLQHAAQRAIVISANSNSRLQFPGQNALFYLRHQVLFVPARFSNGQISFNEDNQSRQEKKCQWQHYPSTFNQDINKS